MRQRLIDPDAVVAPLKEEYKKVKQAFDETSVFQAPNDVALYGALMQEIGALIGMIENAKTVDTEPVRHGKWIGYAGTIGNECSVCGKWLDVLQGTAEMNYCPNCGARMDADE